jgi:hypothetical protein
MSILLFAAIVVMGDESYPGPSILEFQCDRRHCQHAHVFGPASTRVPCIEYFIFHENSEIRQL